MKLPSSRAIVTALGFLGLILGTLLLNMLLLGFAAFRLLHEDPSHRLGRLSETLLADGSLSTEQIDALKEDGSFLLVLDARGQVVNRYEAPADLPAHFTLAEVAAFSRWYLRDYPVHVHTHGNGLIVLGYPKNSHWKQGLEFRMTDLPFLAIWGGVVLGVNLIIVLGASSYLTARSYRRREAARLNWIAAVSHDVRTPLAAVLGYAAELERDASLPAHAREEAKTIRVQGEELRGLIENLNLTSRLTQSMQPLEQSLLSPAALIREAAVRYYNNSQFSPEALTVSIDPAVERLRFYGDMPLLLRMLKNLIQNSFRHNDEDCRVTLSLTGTRRSLRIRVADTGKGYPRAVLERLEGRGTPIAAGHGLGIVCAIARAHGGRVRFYNDAVGAVCEIVFRGRRIRSVNPCLPCKESPQVIE